MIISYSIYWKKYQKCAILGKSSKRVRFIFVSCMSQKIDLSLEGGGGHDQQLPVLQALTQSTTGGYPACKGPFQITLHSRPPDLSNQTAIYLLDSCWRFISRLISTSGFSTCSNQRLVTNSTRKMTDTKNMLFSRTTP